MTCKTCKVAMRELKGHIYQVALPEMQAGAHAGTEKQLSPAEFLINRHLGWGQQWETPTEDDLAL